MVLRPAFTLGGTGGGFADNEAELREMARNALFLSPVHQVLIEKSIKGYKEIEYEVMRDRNDTAIAICNMENIDPVGVHTGDSIVVGPDPRRSPTAMKMLRDSALKIIRALKIEGGCNVQFALDPNSFKYYLIEVNPRVSRSSALASKASGYPIARVTAKIAVGLTLDEIRIANTRRFEPTLDYVVTKMPASPSTSSPTPQQARHADEGHGRGDGHRPHLEEACSRRPLAGERAQPHLASKVRRLVQRRSCWSISKFRSDTAVCHRGAVLPGRSVEEFAD